MTNWLHHRADHRPYIAAVVDALHEMGVTVVRTQAGDRKGLRYAIIALDPPADLADRWYYHELALRWDEREGWSLHTRPVDGEGERRRWMLIDPVVGEPDEVAVALDLRLHGIGEPTPPGPAVRLDGASTVDVDLRSYSAT